jgi:hypothetical protein
MTGFHVNPNRFDPNKNFSFETTALPAPQDEAASVGAPFFRPITRYTSTAPAPFTSMVPTHSQSNAAPTKS